MGVGGCEGGMLCERRKAEGGRDGGTKGQREGACVCVCERERRMRERKGERVHTCICAGV